MKRVLLTLVLVASAAPLFAQNVSTTQMQLVNSAQFTNRLQYLMAQQATVVLAEPKNTSPTCASQRVGYAQKLVTPGSLTTFVSTGAVVIVGGINLTSAAVTGSGQTADSAATDAQILSQIATFWNALAGCPTGS